MSRSIPAKVKPELLVWAREGAGLSIQEAAKRTKFSEEQVKQWEAGLASPTIAQLRKVGEVYKRPIAVFFLARSPEGFAAQREFRRFAGVRPGEESPALRLVLRTALYRREAAEELYALTGDAPLRIKTSLDLKAHPEVAAGTIRGLLGISWEDQLGWGNAHVALNNWRTAMESLGILVFQDSSVELNEMRATCIPDQPLPTILLNTKDAPHGRVFSLMHEFVHILLHAAGHRTTRMTERWLPEDQPIEQKANAFAAAALLPSRPFLEFAERYPGATEGDDDQLRRLADRVKVSPEVVLRRLVTLNRASAEVYREKRRQWQSSWYFRNTPGPVSYSVRTIAKDGPGFALLVLNAYDQRLISTSSAIDYLDARPQHFAAIREDLARRRASWGR